MSSPVLSSSFPVPDGLLLRLIDRDEGWVRASKRSELRGVVLLTRSLARPAGHNLLDVVLTLGIPHLMDPDTAALVEVTPGHARAEWLSAMPAGALVKQPPVAPADLANPDDVELFNRAVLSTQRGAAALSAGYFRIAYADDPWRAINQRLLQAARRTATAGRAVCGWLEVSVEALTKGVVAEVAADYATADAVVLKVAGLTATAASEDEAAALLRAVGDLRRAGPRVLVDGLGTLGTTALAVGAHAVCTAADHHRSVPRVAVHRRPPRGRALGYEVPLQWRQLPLEEALVEAEQGSIGACVDARCEALIRPLVRHERARVLRRHFIHAADADAAFASAAGVAAVAGELQASPDEATQRWGRALQRFADAASSSIHSAR